MSVNYIQCPQVAGVNGQTFLTPNYTTGVVEAIARQINVLNCVIVNSFWKIPWVVGTVVTKYTYEVAVNTSVKPTPDSIKILMVKNLSDNMEYEIVIADTDNVSSSTPINQFAYLADGLGGSLPTMPTVTIPFPIIQFPPSTVSSGTNTFKFAFPPNPLALLYSIPAPWFNGIAPGTPYAPSGITTPAQFVTWANTNWGDYGTWSASGAIVSLVSADTDTAYVVEAGMQIALTPKAYCLNLTAYSTPAPINGIQLGSAAIIPVPAFMLTDVNTALIPVLQKVLPSNTTVYGVATVHKLQVNAIVDTIKLTNNGSVIVTASAAVCS